MGKTVKQLQQEIDSAEFAEWIAYSNIEPFGDDWEQAGTIAAAGQQVWTKRKMTPEQFIPRVKTTKTVEEIQRELAQFAAMHNAKIERLEQQGK